MFEDNHMDKDELLLKSILDSGQEEVPSHIWKGVANGLDRIARRRRFLWIGSSAAAVTAAASLVVGVVLRHGNEDMIVPEAKGDMIAVVENTVESEPVREEVPASTPDKTIKAGKAHTYIAFNDVAATSNNIISEDIPTDKNRESVTAAATPEEKEVPQAEPDTAFWEEEEEEEYEAKRKKIRTSLVISGIAGTNNPQAKGGLAPLKSSGILSAPSKTTVEQVGDQITYGIPVSFGAGVKLHFTKRWSLGVGLNYTLLTSKFNGKYTKVENGLPSMPVSEYVHNTQHYIGIPINAYFNIISHDFINFYAYAGGAVEKCVGNHYRLLTTTSITHKETVKGVQLSANAGLGVEFLLGKHLGLYLDPSLRYYFKGSQPKSIRTAQPLMLGFELGFRFNL